MPVDLKTLAKQQMNKKKVLKQSAEFRNHMITSSNSNVYKLLPGLISRAGDGFARFAARWGSLRRNLLFGGMAADYVKLQGKTRGTRVVCVVKYSL